MRVTAFLAAAALLVSAAGSAVACPMQTAAKDQTVASSSNANSTPIPAKGQQANEG
jgi:hypothetical protein